MNKDEIRSLAEAYISKEEHPVFRGEVKNLLANEDFEELNERFYQNLAFGTGGLRGVIGGGYNRLNSYTIKKATQGLAEYVNSQTKDGSAVIAYDSRNYSDLFAKEAARVLAGNGIKVYLFSSLRPTPELSFAIRHLKTTTGIVITASHNPAQYNGYKAYWSDGCQVTAPHDEKIVTLANSVTEIKTAPEDSPLIEIIDESVDAPYISLVRSIALRPELMKEHGKETKIAFTALHGTGTMPITRALSEMGIEIHHVEEQKEPNGDFPTVKKPNPEEKEALTLGLKLAEEISADLLLATDPDADRLGIAVPNASGKFVLVTGNQLGALLADYIFSSRKELGTLPEKPAFIKTIVTTNLQRKIAEHYGATSFDVLTGFKYIGEKIKEFEESGEGYTYLFGGEESYGYLATTEVRDKDAVSAATLTAEMALYLRSKGSSILKRLEEIWETHGYYEEALLNFDFEGMAGAQKIASIMKNLRANTPAAFADTAVAEVRDYSLGIKGLPTSNVLQYELIDGTIITARPSGTEPKIKFYISANEKCDDLSSAKSAVSEKIHRFSKAITDII